MTSIVCISDAHLGYRHRFKVERLKDYERAFCSALERALELKPSVIVLGGDILHHAKPDPKSMRTVLKLLIKAADRTQIIVCIGNHEISGHLGTTYSLIFSDLHRNIHVLSSDEPHIIIRADGKQIGFHGFQYLRSRQMAEKMLDKISKEVSGNDINILCLHQAVEKYLSPHEISLRALRDAAPNYDLILLGHVHKHQRVAELSDIVPAYYIGSTERISFNEWKNPNGYMVFTDYNFNEPEFVKVDSATMKRVKKDAGKIAPKDLNRQVEEIINDNKDCKLLQVNVSAKVTGDFFDVRSDFSDTFPDFTVLDVNIQPSVSERKILFEKFQLSEDLIREYFEQMGMGENNELLETCIELYNEY